jgi:CO/xanthine dehydrogenase FAD-binding subunit
MEIGSMIKLNKIIHLGKIVPEVLCICLENIAGVQLRNIATIGGNICCHSKLLDASAPLTALDAQYELRNAQSSRWVAASRFHSLEEHGAAADASNPRPHGRTISSGLEDQELLTRIRLPIQQWNYSVYKKFISNNTSSSKVLIFLAKTPKNILSDIRVVYKGNTILRNKNGENILTGKNLPLSRKIALDFVENWNEHLTENKIDEFTKYELLNSIKENIFNLSE